MSATIIQFPTASSNQFPCPVTVRALDQLATLLTEAGHHVWAWDVTWEADTGPIVFLSPPGSDACLILGCDTPDAPWSVSHSHDGIVEDTAPTLLGLVLKAIARIAE
jgi:hypothetical protein